MVFMGVVGSEESAVQAGMSVALRPTLKADGISIWTRR